MSLPSSSLYSQSGTVTGMFISNKMIAWNFSQYRRYRTRRSHEAFHSIAGIERDDRTKLFTALLVSNATISAKYAKYY